MGCDDGERRRTGSHHNLLLVRQHSHQTKPIPTTTRHQILLNTIIIHASRTLENITLPAGRFDIKKSLILWCSGKVKRTKKKRIGSSGKAALHISPSLSVSRQS